MSSFPALGKLRLGCVRYLNARPLVHAYRGEITLDHPAQLAQKLIAGELDVALVPLFTALENPGFPIVDGVSISSRGAVFSVALAHRESLMDVKSVALDPASRTSSHLLQVLLAEFHDSHPRFVPSPPADAQLFIGNQAIAFRQKHGDSFSYLDLGEDWTRRTGLPFVFAVWLLRPEVTCARAVADELRSLKRMGLVQLEVIAKSQTDFSAEFAQHYLSENIRFDLGGEEKAGLAQFRGLLEKHGLVARNGGELTFV